MVTRNKSFLHTRGWWQTGILLLFALSLFAYYATEYKYHFFWQEQNQLFLYSADWVSTYFDKPAWLSVLLGEYLTQFYYYLYAGPAILTLVITLAVSRIWRVLRHSTPIFVSVILGIATAVLLVMCSFNSANGLDVFLSILGGAAFFDDLHSKFHPSEEHKKEKKNANIIYIVATVVIVALVYWLFGGIGTLTFAILAVISLIGYHRINDIVAAILAWAMTFAVTFVLSNHYTLKYSDALIYPGISAPKTPEKASERILAVDNEYYFGNYEKAKQLALSDTTANPVTAFYYYLSSAKTDSLPENLLKYPLRELGTLNQVGEDTPLAIINMMPDLYYELGDMTYAERAAMMRNVFSPQNRNVRMVKRLAQANLVSGDTVAALKYLRILDKTHVYADWARYHMPGSMSPVVSHDIYTRRANSNTCDTLRLGDNCRTILVELLESNPENTLALDYLLCTDLLLKEMDTFKYDYDRYCMSTGRQRPRKLYQEALMIYLAGTNAPEDEWRRYITMPQMLQRFNEYSAHRGDSRYADTYWYYFDTTK